ncbi:hypothetical protein GCM10020255_008800 [Rhodococcus baikonurensis]
MAYSVSLGEYVSGAVSCEGGVENDPDRVALQLVLELVKRLGGLLEGERTADRAAEIETPERSEAHEAPLPSITDPKCPFTCCL